MLVPRLRGALGPLLEKLASHLPPYPNAYTLASVAAALLAAYMGVARLWWLALLFFTVSALLDAVDGAVARSRGLVSRSGALLDSVADRVSDAALATGYLGLGVNPVIIDVLVASLLVYSYVRARAEGITCRRLEGLGFMERGERTPFLLAPYLLAAIGYAALAALLVEALTALMLVALVDRVARAYRVVREA